MFPCVVQCGSALALLATTSQYCYYSDSGQSLSYGSAEFLLADLLYDEVTGHAKN